MDPAWNLSPGSGHVFMCEIYYPILGYKKKIGIKTEPDALTHKSES